jgi:hypothetical protein
MGTGSTILRFDFDFGVRLGSCGLAISMHLSLVDSHGVVMQILVRQL